MDKLLHVSCIVRETHVYDLLRGLETHKVGNVEVRPVAPQLALPAPSTPRTSRGFVQPKVRAIMELKKKLRVPEIAREIGAKKQSVHSAMGILMKEGVVKRVGVGLYMRVKPDPQQQPQPQPQANGGTA